MDHKLLLPLTLAQESIHHLLDQVLHLLASQVILLHQDLMVTTLLLLLVNTRDLLPAPGLLQSTTDSITRSDRKYSLVWLTTCTDYHLIFPQNILTFHWQLSPTNYNRLYNFEYSNWSMCFAMIESDSFS